MRDTLTRNVIKAAREYLAYGGRFRKKDLRDAVEKLTAWEVAHGKPERVQCKCGWTGSSDDLFDNGLFIYCPKCRGTEIERAQ